MLVDASNLIARTHFAFNTRTSKGVSSGMFYGTIRNLYTKIMKYDIDKVLICYDKKPYWRSTVFPQYKMDRRPMEETMGTTMEEYVEQKHDLQKVLPMFFDCLSFPGYEADDLIAAYAWKLVNEGEEVIVYSSDHDFLQLINNKVSILKTGYKTDTIINEKNYYEKAGVFNNEQLLAAFGIAGDNSDNIPSMFAKPSIQEDGSILWIEPKTGKNRAITFSKALKIVSSPYNKIEDLLNGKMNPVKGIGNTVENMFLKINDTNREYFERNIKITDLTNGEHKYSVLEENKNLFKYETRENADENIVKFLIEKYEVKSLSLTDNFPFYHMSDVSVDKPKVNRNQFMEMMKKKKEEHFKK
jgi:5'-3' exonuclease